MNTPLALPAPKTILMRTLPLTAEEIREILHVTHTRSFEVTATTGASYAGTRKEWPYRGKFKTYPRYVNLAFLTSYATVSDSMVTIHHAGKEDVVKRAPKGMVFSSDDNGVKLVRQSDGMEYHPDRHEWLFPKFALLIRARMAHNFNRRAAGKRAQKESEKNKRENDRREKLFQRDLATTRVTLLDSRIAGNCIEGSLSFAERKLGIDRKEILGAGYLFSVPADKLLKVANGDTAAATRAAKAAWNRETMVSI